MSAECQTYSTGRGKKAVWSECLFSMSQLFLWRARWIHLHKHAISGLAKPSSAHEPGQDLDRAPKRDPVPNYEPSVRPSRSNRVIKANSLIRNCIIDWDHIKKPNVSFHDSVYPRVLISLTRSHRTQGYYLAMLPSRLFDQCPYVRILPLLASTEIDLLATGPIAFEKGGGTKYCTISWGPRYTRWAARIASLSGGVSWIRARTSLTVEHWTCSRAYLQVGSSITRMSRRLKSGWNFLQGEVLDWVDQVFAILNSCTWVSSLNWLYLIWGIYAQCVCLVRTGFHWWIPFSSPHNASGSGSYGLKLALRWPASTRIDGIESSFYNYFYSNNRCGDGEILSSSMSQ